MTTTNKAYKMGYEMGRAELEQHTPEKNAKATNKVLKGLFREFKNHDDVFEGISAAQFDYESGNEWEF